MFFLPHSVCRESRLRIASSLREINDPPEVFPRKIRVQAIIDAQRETLPTYRVTIFIQERVRSRRKETGHAWKSSRLGEIRGHIILRAIQWAYTGHGTCRLSASTEPLPNSKIATAPKQPHQIEVLQSRVFSCQWGMRRRWSILNRDIGNRDRLLVSNWVMYLEIPSSMKAKGIRNTVLTRYIHSQNRRFLSGCYYCRNKTHLGPIVRGGTTSSIHLSIIEAPTKRPLGGRKLGSNVREHFWQKVSVVPISIIWSAAFFLPFSSFIGSRFSARVPFLVYLFLAEVWVSIPVLLGRPFLQDFLIFPAGIPCIYPYRVDPEPDRPPYVLAVLVYLKAGNGF